MFPQVCRIAGLPEPIAEHRFHQQRKWRFDWAFPQDRIAIEVDGGIWTRGRHTRGAGFVKDMEKLNAAVLAGWRVFRVTPEQLLTVGIDLVVALRQRDREAAA